MLLWSTLSNTDLGASVSALLCVEVQGRVSKLFFANMFPIQETTTTTSTGTTAASYNHYRNHGFNPNYYNKPLQGMAPTECLPSACLLA